MGKVIIFSAPSGAGKSTIVNHLLNEDLGLEFSISATSRAPRGKEKHGKEYYFFSQEEFQKRIDAGEFLEWEEVYPGCFYGTLKCELERIWAKGHTVVFDVDVVGGLNIKKTFGKDALSGVYRGSLYRRVAPSLGGTGDGRSRKDRATGGKGRV